MPAPVLQAYQVLYVLEFNPMIDDPRDELNALTAIIDR